ncbi:MAG: 30S ribosomal protein S2 [Acidobacteriota bacterium]
MATIQLRELLDAGAHFGHQTKRWNPKMRPYIFGSRNGIYVIDLKKTLRCFGRAAEFVTRLGMDGKTLLFVGTKRQAKDVVEEAAEKAGMPYVSQRWLGGMLTNFNTLRKSTQLLKELETLETNARYRSLTKKERLKLMKEREKLSKVLTGIKNMGRIPDAIFVIDPEREHIAVAEAAKLNIPVVSVVDTNCDPDLVDFVIPSNDDAMRAIKLFTHRLADAFIEGKRAGKDRRPDRQDGPRTADGSRAEIVRAEEGPGEAPAEAAPPADAAPPAAEAAPPAESAPGTEA